MRMGSPNVSIGLPVYNGERYLTEAIDSILGQTFSDLELLISDNASTDGTEDICQSYAAKDSRVRYLRQNENLGAAPNYNEVFHVSRGKYFKWAAHDDVLEPTMVERCQEVLEQESDVVVCAPYTRIIGAEGEFLKDLGLEIELLEPSPDRRLGSFLRYHRSPRECNAVFGLIRSSVLGKTGLIGSYPASDMILLAHLALRGKIAIVPEPLFLRRDHENTSIRSTRTMEERAAWFNTRKASGGRRTAWYWVWQYFRGILGAPLGIGEHLRCQIALARYAKAKRHALVGELRPGR